MKQAVKADRLRQIAAFLWIALLLFFQTGVGIHIHQCQHCGTHKTEICTEKHECHDCNGCHNCHNCFIILKLNDFFHSEKTQSLSPQATQRLFPTAEIRINPMPNATTVHPDGWRQHGEASPPTRAGNDRYLHFSHRLLFYA